MGRRKHVLSSEQIAQSHSADVDDHPQRIAQVMCVVGLAIRFVNIASRGRRCSSRYLDLLWILNLPINCLRYSFPDPLVSTFDSTRLAGSARRSSSCDQITLEGITGTVHGVNLITAIPGCLLTARRNLIDLRLIDPRNCMRSTLPLRLAFMGHL